MPKRKFPPNRVFVVFERETGHILEAIHPEDMALYEPFGNTKDQEVAYEYVIKPKKKDSK